MARNEPADGAVIEPNREWRFGHLAAVRRVSSRERRPHRELVSADLGLTVPREP